MSTLEMACTCEDFSLSSCEGFVCDVTLKRLAGRAQLKVLFSAPQLAKTLVTKRDNCRRPEQGANRQIIKAIILSRTLSLIIILSSRSCTRACVWGGGFQDAIKIRPAPATREAKRGQVAKSVLLKISQSHWFIREALLQHYAAINSDFYVFVRLPNKYFAEPRCKKLTHFLALNLFLVVDKFMMRPIYKTTAL